MTAKELQVRARLGWVMVLIEVASVSLLLILFGREIVPDRVGFVLIFLFPIAFGLHVLEEFVVPGGFISWDNLYRPSFSETPGTYYVKVNGIPGIASLLVSLGAFDYAGKFSFFGIRAWLAFSTFMAWNAFFHVRGAVHTRRYSPGMVTGALLFVPLVVASYIHFRNRGAIDGLAMVFCVAFALAIQPFLDFIKSHGSGRHA